MRFPEFSGEWKHCIIGDILSIKHGRDYKNEPSQKNLYPVLGTGGEITKIDTFLCDWSCACIGRKGTINKPIYMDSPFWCVDTLFYSQPFHGENSKFQYYLFETINWILYNEASGVPSLSASTIEKIRVNVPNINEQIKIVQFFSLIDYRISKQRELIDKLKSYKRGLLSRLFPQKGETIPEHRFRDFTNDWEQRKLGDYCEMYNGDRSSKYPNANDMVDEGIPFINAGDLENGTVNLTTCNKISREKYNDLSGAKLQIGDIVYCLRGTLGKNAFIDNFEEGTVASSLVAIRPQNINGRYLYYILNSDIEYRQRIVHDEGAAQPNLSAKSVSEFEIPVPQLAEQQKIGQYFEGVDNLITLHQEKWELYVNIKSALLQKMFI